MSCIDVCSNGTVVIITNPVKWSRVGVVCLEEEAGDQLLRV